MTMVLPPESTISKSCDWDCAMCPKEPKMPRSYHSNEPAVARAAEVNFDAFEQFNSRANTLKHNGHPIDKVEFILLGGTFVNHDRKN
jgi:elongator complex protein 3